MTQQEVQKQRQILEQAFLPLNHDRDRWHNPHLRRVALALFMGGKIHRKNVAWLCGVHFKSLYVWFYDQNVRPLKPS